MAAAQADAAGTTECFYGIADLHAMTVASRSGTAALASSARPRHRCSPPASTHRRSSSRAGCRRTPSSPTCSSARPHTGELNRMIQFKEKGTRRRLDPGVPVHLPGADGRRHPALPARSRCRSATTSASTSSSPATSPSGSTGRYGPVFTVPEIATPRPGARVLALLTTRPGRWASPPRRGRRRLPPRPARRRTPQGRARGDRLGHRPGRGPARDPAKPGVTNLLDILAACGGSADGITTYGALKRAVTDAVVAAP